MRIDKQHEAKNDEPKPATAVGGQLLSGEGDDPLLFELLSERLLRDFPHRLWHETFMGAAYGTIRFMRGPVTFVCISELSPEWSEIETSMLASRFSGFLESFGPRTTLTFADPADALEVSIHLQRSSDRSLRIALMSATCQAAYFEVDQGTRRVTLGDAAGTAAAQIERASRGSIHVSAECYERIASRLDRSARLALVTTEVVDGVLRSLGCAHLRSG